MVLIGILERLAICLRKVITMMRIIIISIRNISAVVRIIVVIIDERLIISIVIKYYYNCYF